MPVCTDWAQLQVPPLVTVLGC